MSVTWLAALNLAKAHWKLALVGVLVALLAVQSVRLSHRGNQLERVKINLNEARAERDSLIAAAKEAERLNKEQVSRIVNEQDRISNERQADLTARLERLRSELRSKADNRNPQGPGASPDVPGSPGADGEARVCLTPEELLRAATNEEKHDQLITLLEQMGLIKR